MKEIKLLEQTFILHPNRAIYWRDQRALLIADLHLGKAAHFRRAGIAVPQGVGNQNFRRLTELINAFQPERILILGDLFHSTYNQVWPLFCDFLKSHSTIRFELIPGNHDILPTIEYERSGLLLQAEVYLQAPFCLSHHPLDTAEVPETYYNLCGHIHPCVRLSGNANQRLRLPCFYFGARQGILPAFGAFTGGGTIPVRKGDRVYVLADNSVVEIQAQVR